MFGLVWFGLFSHREKLKPNTLHHNYLNHVRMLSLLIGQICLECEQEIQKYRKKVLCYCSYYLANKAGYNLQIVHLIVESVNIRPHS